MICVHHVTIFPISGDFVNITFSVFAISGDFVYITDSAYTQSQIRQMEIEILKVLNFDLVTVISHLVAKILTLQWGSE